jgi:hypothetical protein
MNRKIARAPFYWAFVTVLRVETALRDSNNWQNRATKTQGVRSEDRLGRCGGFFWVASVGHYSLTPPDHRSKLKIAW